MSMSEFELIEHYFTQHAGKRADVLLGIGDDAALVDPSSQQLVMTMDTLNVNVHFFSDMPADALGYKTLAVNLSDLAAMGADPAWVCLSISLPEINTAWLEDFCTGFSRLLKEHSLQLIGGDTCRGALSFTVHATGFVDKNLALRRDTAKVGDLIYVTGELGAAALALQALQKKIDVTEQDFKQVLDYLYYPTARIALGKNLRGLAHAAIDISDGLSGDLQHILVASNVGAILYADDIPIHPSLLNYYSPAKALHLALSGGEDYELCFTIPATKKAALEKILAEHCYLIGEITEEPTCYLQHPNGQRELLTNTSYQHF